ncbi:hypothetical protein HK096_009491 [Nowakowskiella sp. JEL0078]|nr:hypothetical protein HK096_009491 [Nowakowskiella sp. JEL0078]
MLQLEKLLDFVGSIIAAKINDAKDGDEIRQLFGFDSNENPVNQGEIDEDMGDEDLNEEDYEYVDEVDLEEEK